MILQAKTVNANEGYVRTDNIINITKEGEQELNERIRKAARKSDIKRQKDLSIARECLVKNSI